MCEKLDIYNENKIKTGKIIERKEEVTIEKNEFVLAVQCWIINTKNEILLTQRNLDKKYGGMWEATSGLVKSGENCLTQLNISIVVFGGSKYVKKRA